MQQANPGLVTRDQLKRQERETIINALKRTNGKVSGTRWRCGIAGHEALDLGVAHLLFGHQSQDALLRGFRFARKTAACTPGGSNRNSGNRGGRREGRVLGFTHQSPKRNIAGHTASWSTGHRLRANVTFIINRFGLNPDTR